MLHVENLQVLLPSCDERTKTQTFDTTLFWKYIDWYASGYDSGTVPDPRMAGKWKDQGCVKSGKYRAAWKQATRRYAEEREKSLRPGTRCGRDWVGAGTIAAEVRAAHGGYGP